MTVDPPSQSVEVTKLVKFTTTVSGVGKENFSYQWRHNGVDIDRATSNSYTITSETEDSGNYDCVVTNGYGDKANSTGAELSKSIYQILITSLLYYHSFFY